MLYYDTMFNFIIAFFCFFAARSGVERNIDRPALNRGTVELADWHDEHRELKFLIVSDIHFRRSDFRDGSAERLLEKINSAGADFILLLGDYLYLPRNPSGSVRGKYAFSNIDIPGITGFFRRMKAKRGIFAICGNHEERYGVPGFIESMKHAGNVRFLDGNLVSVRVNGKRFILGGLTPETSTYRRMRMFGRRASGADPVILLCHNPEPFPEMPESVELMLSGHLHGGQINLPFFRNISFAPPYCQPYQRGLFRNGRSRLIVTSGVGAGNVNLRVGAPPEMLLLTFRKESNNCANASGEPEKPGKL